MRQSFLGVVGELDSLPGCGQIAISHGVFVPLSHRNKGLGRMAHEQRLVEARRLGYQVVICTVDGANEPQLKLLKDFGWEFNFEFQSKKTGHMVQLWSKSL